MDPKLLALASATCFGLSPILIKRGFGKAGRLDAAVMVALAIAIPVYLVILPFVGGLHWEEVTPRAFAGFAIGGLFGAGIGRRWMYIAIDRIGTSPATAIKNSSPLFTTVVAAVLFAEPVTLDHWLATVAIVAGIVLVTWRGGKRFGLLDAGVLAALGSALSYGIRPVILKFGLEDASLPVTAAIVGALSGLLYATVMSRPWRSHVSLRGLVQELRDPAMPAFTGSGILQALGILSLTAALSGADVSLVYPINASAPLFTVVFSWLFLRGAEVVTGRMAIGAVLVVAGVMVL